MNSNVLEVYMLADWQIVLELNQKSEAEEIVHSKSASDKHGETASIYTITAENTILRV
jgi:hypothetical protein